MSGASDYQVGGDHYAQKEIQVWDIVEGYGLTFWRGSALKYLLRAGMKPGSSAVQDLRKARHYIEKAIEIEEKKESDERPNGA